MALEAKIQRREAAGTGSDPLVAGVAVFARRPAELTGFYEQVLRTSFTHRVHEDGREHWIASLDGVQLEVKALAAADGVATTDAFASSTTTGMSRSEWSFRVPNVEAAVARAILAGGALLQRAEQHEWGTFAVVADPEDNRVGLFTPPPASHQHSNVEEQA